MLEKIFDKSEVELREVGLAQCGVPESESPMEIAPNAAIQGVGNSNPAENRKSTTSQKDLKIEKILAPPLPIRSSPMAVHSVGGTKTHLTHPEFPRSDS